jgi:predicted RNA binding protein YcfA (HicA-like mRNA interferase family)
LNDIAAVDSHTRVCTIHTVKSADLIRLLKKNGWVLRGSKGSHHVFTHPQRPGHISVPHPKKDLGAGLLAKLMQQAGLTQGKER